jgi:hypothetical protein
MLDVGVTIVHPTMNDLTVTLTSPAGIEKPVFYDGLEWNLAAATDFWGQSLDGTWVLTASDQVGDGVTGTLEAWSITASTLNGPGVTVTPTSGLTTSEAGGRASFMVILNSQPTGVVSVNFCPDDVSEGRLEHANSDDQTLIFDPGNWDDPQEVTVIGMDDTLADGDVSYTVIAIISDSDDPDYVGIDPDDVEIVNLDDGDGAAPLLAAFAGTSTADEVTLGQIHDITAQALELWSAHLAAPVTSDIQVALADLAPGRLGETHQHTILLDINANGAGWFVDPTPWEDSEFSGANSLASGLVDMLTVVAHEIGHVLGFEHSPDAHDVMAAHLTVGTRRLPGFTTPLVSPRLQALDQVYATFGQMESAKRDDEADPWTDNELRDLLAFAGV